jgi:hypothetical protein
MRSEHRLFTMSTVFLRTNFKHQKILLQSIKRATVI